MIGGQKFLYGYILKCADGSYYTGITNDYERRLSEHNEGMDAKSYTYRRRPVELVFVEYFKNYNQAIAFEKQIKGWSRKKKEALIEENWERIQELAICKNETSHTRFNNQNTEIPPLTHD